MFETIFNKSKCCVCNNANSVLPIFLLCVIYQILLIFFWFFLSSYAFISIFRWAWNGSDFNHRFEAHPMYSLMFSSKIFIVTTFWINFEKFLDHYLLLIEPPKWSYDFSIVWKVLNFWSKMVDLWQCQGWNDKNTWVFEGFIWNLYYRKISVRKILSYSNCKWIHFFSVSKFSFSF